jgi:DNA mismatch repair protein MutS
MSELRNIISHADSNSLVLGDEICCGTEHSSANAIVSAAIERLLQQKCSFIFTTHLHDLLIPSSYNIRISHLHVDRTGSELVFDRKLRDGKGYSLYGLEVCDYLGFDKEFMKSAHKYRVASSTTEPASHSKYNKNVEINTCKICGEKANDIHHITEQHKQTFDKNFKYNLVSVCKSCHIKVHEGQIDVQGWISTSRGTRLLFNEKEFSSDLNTALVDELLSRKLTKTAIVKHLKEEGFPCSLYKLNKYLQSKLVV